MLTPIFILSGLVLVVLLIAKRIEEKKRKSVFILNLISRGDAQVREIHHRMVEYYSSGKEKGIFIVKKQLPRYSRSSLNKALALLEERVQKHFDNIRDSRLLKKSDGISEFFKTISEVEKGNGELHDDVYVEETQEIIASAPVQRDPVIEVRFEIAEPVVEEKETLSTLNVSDAPTESLNPKPKKPRARRPSTKRKLKVVSEETEQFV